MRVAFQNGPGKIAGPGQGAPGRTFGGELKLRPIRTALTCIFLAAGALPTVAACDGQNILLGMDAERKAELDAAIAAQPYPKGNVWRATRGDQTVFLVGTYHLDDPRHKVHFPNIAPLIDAADIVLVEATEEEEAKMVAAMTKSPDLLFRMTGPTLPERMAEADWQALAAALRERGMPPFMASKMQPWYVSMILATPPCAMDQMMKSAEGLDTRVMARAKANGTPLRSLEPYDTAFHIFDRFTDDQQLEMIRTAIALDDRAEDFARTLSDAYFAEDTRAIWELSRIETERLPGSDAGRVSADYADMEAALMAGRNRSWIPRIEEAVQEGTVLAAFGALHLSGQEGVVALLERAGFTMERLPF